MTVKCDYYSRSFGPGCARCASGAHTHTHSHMCTRCGASLTLMCAYRHRTPCISYRNSVSCSCRLPQPYRRVNFARGIVLVVRSAPCCCVDAISSQRRVVGLWRCTRQVLEAYTTLHVGRRCKTPENFVRSGRATETERERERELPPQMGQRCVCIFVCVCARAISQTRRNDKLCPFHAAHSDVARSLCARLPELSLCVAENRRRARAYQQILLSGQQQRHQAY